MNDLFHIQVRAPKFELYQQVILYWNRQEHLRQIVRRWLDLEDGCWWYKVQGSEPLYPEDVFGPPRPEEVKAVTNNES